MKYIKLYENFKDIDLFDEEDWDETENDSSFLWWLNKNYSNENIWKNITEINCSYNDLENLNGIENCINLKYLNCSHNNLTSLKGIENLVNLRILCCNNNKLENLNEIENLTKLKLLNYFHNNLTNLNGIENLTNLKILNCKNNKFSNEYKQYLKDELKNIIYLDI
jgi:Leucine-rich repeat (LRR) protein